MMKYLVLYNVDMCFMSIVLHLLCLSQNNNTLIITNSRTIAIQTQLSCYLVRKIQQLHQNEWCRLCSSILLSVLPFIGYMI